MNFLRVIGELFVLYILYKLIFDFIIPIAQTTRQVKRQFGDIQEKMNQFNQQQQTNNTPPKSSPKPSNEDYIDYEEVK
jgi:hypothetical protein